MKIITQKRISDAYRDSSGWASFLLAAADSSCSLSLSTAWAFFSSSEKFCLLTFWAPRPPFLEANYKEKQHECICSILNGKNQVTVHTVFLAAAGFFLIRDESSGKPQDKMSLQALKKRNYFKTITPTWICFWGGTQQVHTWTLLCLIWKHKYEFEQKVGLNIAYINYYHFCHPLFEQLRSSLT